MKNSHNHLINKRSFKGKNLLLFTVFLLTFNSNYQSVEAYPNNRKEAAAEHKICEEKEDIIDKIYCMKSLRMSLGDYGESSYSGSLLDKSDRKLRAIYRKERKRAQVKIARLPIDE